MAAPAPQGKPLLWVSAPKRAPQTEQGPTPAHSDTPPRHQLAVRSNITFIGETDEG